MKVYLFKVSIFFLLAFPSVVFSQEEKSIWIDAKAGLNSVWVVNQNAYNNKEMDYSTTFGLSAGMGVNYFLNEGWGLNFSPGYIQLGQNYSDNTSTGDVTRKLKLAYIQLPFLLMRKVPMTNDPTWIAFGPDIMILTGAKQDFKINSGAYPLNNPDGMISGDIKRRFNPVDIALDFSVNKMFELVSNDNMMFLLSFNSSVGLLDISSKDWQLPNLHGEYKGSHNFYFGLKAGLMFRVSDGR